MIENPTSEINEEGCGVEYTEVPVESFSEAVRTIKDANGLVKEGYCLVDIDGTLVDTLPFSLPIVSHGRKPEISGKINGSFIDLVETLDGNVSIITNRNTVERIFWNSHHVLDAVRGLTEQTQRDIKIFTSLNRQVPKVAMKQIESMAEHLSSSINGNKAITLFVIEDKSVISPNRGAFFKCLGSMLNDKYGIDTKVMNFVIK